MLSRFLNDVPLWIVGCVLVAGLALAAEAGLGLGRRAARGGADKDADNLATATLGLLALLIAFTYSMALARYDARRQVVLEEANAIGSTANFALMLPNERQAPVLSLLRDYARARLELGAPYAPGKLERDVARSNQLLGQLWTQAVDATAAEPQSLPLYRYVASLNETNNVAEKRLTLLRNHVPVAIPMLLVGTALIAMGFVGYASGVGGVNRQVSTVIMAALLSLLIVVTQDLVRPDRGMIQVPMASLRDCLAAVSALAPRGG